MDSSITAAGRALRAADPLGALKRVALRDDPAALALRGIAIAQLGDLGRARESPAIWKRCRPSKAVPASQATSRARTILSQTRSFRLLFSTGGRWSQILLSLSVFEKRTQRAPQNEIDLAQRRLADWRRRG